MSVVSWLAKSEHEGRTTARVGRLGDRLVAEWAGVGRLSVRQDGSDAHFEAEPGCDPIQRAKVEGGAVKALLCSLQGHLGVHAASVSLNGRAILLLGRSGDGKSTLAAAFCRRSGCALLSDDVAILERSKEWLVASLEPNHFLDRTALSALGADGVASPLRSKLAIPAPRTAAAPTPLQLIIRLSFAGDLMAPSLRPVGRVEALGELVPQVLRLVVDDPVVARAEFESLIDLVGAVPAFHLSRPRRLEQLPAVVDMICGVLERAF